MRSGGRRGCSSQNHLRRPPLHFPGSDTRHDPIGLSHLGADHARRRPVQRVAAPGPGRRECASPWPSRVRPRPGLASHSPPVTRRGQRDTRRLHRDRGSPALARRTPRRSHVPRTFKNSQRSLTAFAVQVSGRTTTALVSVRQQPDDRPGQSGLPCCVSPEPLNSPKVNDVGRVANVVSDDVGYPAPWQALPGVVFRKRARPPCSRRPLRCEYVSCLGKFLFACFDGSNGSEGTPPWATFPPKLLSTTASATFSYIWDLSRRVDAGNDQADPCWIRIPSCKNSHASSGGSARLRTTSPSSA